MLLDRSTEARVLQLLQAIGGAYSVYTIGRSLGQSVTQALSSALSGRKLTVLEQAFLAGKVASQVGTDALKTMTSEDITSWIRTNNVDLNDRETATLNQLRDDTERWITGRTDDWQKRFRTAISTADKDWRGTIMNGRFLDAGARSTARNGALTELIDQLKDENNNFSSQIDRLLQTEMHSYFQQGQISGASGDEMVYKVPRPGACPYCMDLHVNGDGAPILYKLSDVAGNSNYGLPAYAWNFTIGPVHPHCYCILYRADQEPPKANETLKKALADLKEQRKGAETQPETHFEELLKSAGRGEAPPLHQIKLIAAVREVYGDDPPRN